MNGLARRARLAGRLLRTQGPGWLAFRLGYAAARRSGWLRRRSPATAWDAQPLAGWLRDPALAGPDRYLAHRSQPPPFFFDPAGMPDPERFRPWDEALPGPVAEADDLAFGKLRYFARTPTAVGWPPRWLEDPTTGRRLAADRHWTAIDDFQGGDIKRIWEPSRFTFTFTLARAYARTGDPAYPELFWRAVDDWRAENPPQQGPNWKCGQEVSLRLMAWCWGLYAFARDPATTAPRVAALAQMVAVSARRVEVNLGYALSQRNNHGVSEAVGLWTAGLLFPEFRDAPRWRERGRRTLEALARDLIDDGGAFAQHSVNYQRLMLHDYLWAVRLGDLHARPLTAELRRRVGLAGELLRQLQDDRTGRLPGYGHDDGSLILPLSNDDPDDYRPVTQAVHYLSTGRRAHGDGPWDESLHWLFGPDAPAAPVDRGDLRDTRSTPGGYFTLRSDTGFAFVRCAKFRHRPGQSDQLHLDLWWRGQNVAPDGGTYSYNAPAPWDHAFAGAADHNTVTVDGLDQADRVGRFLWLPWPQGRVLDGRRSSGGRLAYWEGEHSGYARLARPVCHRRGVLRLDAEHWLVVDELASAGTHHYRLHWRLADWHYSREPVEGGGGVDLTLETPAGAYQVRSGRLGGVADVSLCRADPRGTRGWRAPHYLGREPSVSLAVECRAASARFWTLLGPPGVAVEFDDRGLDLRGPGWSAAVELGTDPGRPLVTDAVWDGPSRDALRGLAPEPAPADSRAHVGT